MLNLSSWCGTFHLQNLFSLSPSYKVGPAEEEMCPSPILSSTWAVWIPQLLLSGLWVWRKHLTFRAKTHFLKHQFSYLFFSGERGLGLDCADVCEHPFSGENFVILTGKMSFFSGQLAILAWPMRGIWIKNDITKETDENDKEIVHCS